MEFEQASQVVEHWPHWIAGMQTLLQTGREGGKSGERAREAGFEAFIAQLKQLNQEYRRCGDIIRSQEIELSRVWKGIESAKEISETSAHMLSVRLVYTFRNSVWNGMELVAGPKLFGKTHPQAGRKDSDPLIRPENRQLIFLSLDKFPEFDSDKVSKLIRLDRFDLLKLNQEAAGDEETVDYSNYAPLSELIIQRPEFKNVAELKRYLKKNTTIELRNPNTRRCVANLGDWHRHWLVHDDKKSELLDGETAANIHDEIAERYKIEHKKKRNNGSS